MISFRGERLSFDSELRVSIFLIFRKISIYRTFVRVSFLSTFVAEENAGKEKKRGREIQRAEEIEREEEREAESGNFFNRRPSPDSTTPTSGMSGIL